MIPIVYFRSSSFNCHRFCPMQYYMEYTLGWRGPSGLAADKGTIVHKILEIAAVCKKGLQNGKKSIVDDQIGEVLTGDYRSEYMDEIINRVYEYYTSRITHHNWTPRHFRDCHNWTWKALNYGNGMFDPRNRSVVEAEPHFDFEIKRDWAKYSYDIDGEKLEGFLSMKGTIDLLTDLGDGVVEVIDWKTGQYRKDWATGKTKTQENLFYDPQLRIYHYAIKHMFPEISSLLMTIYYINAGGPYTIHFQDKDIPQTEKMLEKRFNTIKNTSNPALVRVTNPSDSWKCSKLCHQGKTTFEGTDIRPMKESRPRQVTPMGEVMTKCEQMRCMLKTHGIEWTNVNCTHPEHAIGKYKAPGEV